MFRRTILLFLSISSVALWVSMDSSPAEAQIFRRLQALRQSRSAPAPRPQPGYRPPAQQPRYQQPGQPRYQPPRSQRAPVLTPSQQAAQQTRMRSFNRTHPQGSAIAPVTSMRPGVQPRSSPAVANYSRVPMAVGPVALTPTLASPAVSVPDNIAGERKASEVSSERQEAVLPSSKTRSKSPQPDLGQSILTRAKPADDPQNKKVKTKDSPKQGNESNDSQEEKKEEEDEDTSMDRPAKESKESATMGLDVYQHAQPQDGVRIARIGEASQADESGLRVGDMIVAIDQNRVRSVRDMAALLRVRNPGQNVRVEFVRGGTAYITQVPLISSKLRKRVTVAKPPVPTIKLGMMIDDPRSLRGTVVTSVRNGSIAKQAGLKTGDRIVSIDGELLRSGAALRSILAQRRYGEKLAMGIVRKGELISRDVELTSPSDRALVKSQTNPPKSPKTAAGEKKQASGLAKGIGSMIGGLFAGKTSAEKKSSAEKETAASDDPMAFGDDESVEQVIFQKPVRSSSGENKSSSKLPAPKKNPLKAISEYQGNDPPSLRTLELPPAKITAMKEQDSLKKAEARKLRDQILRLESELQAIEGLASE